MLKELNNTIDADVHATAKEAIFENSAMNKPDLSELWKSLTGAGGSALTSGLELVKKGILPEVSLERAAELFETKIDAQRAVEIIARREDLGTDMQKRELEKMFAEARANGTEKELIAEINKQLEQRGCQCRLTVGNEVQSAGTFPFTNNQVVTLVTTDAHPLPIDNFVVPAPNRHANEL